MAKQPSSVKKNLGGRPKTWETPQALHEDIKAFKVHCEQEELIPFKVTFCNWKGCSKDTIADYAKRDGFSDYIKELEGLAEQELIQGATKGKLNPTMSIFLLKNHHGYKDKSEQDINATVKTLSDHDELYK